MGQTGWVCVMWVDVSYWRYGCAGDAEQCRELRTREKFGCAGEHRHGDVATSFAVASREMDGTEQYVAFYLLLRDGPRSTARVPVFLLYIYRIFPQHVRFLMKT